MRLSSDRLVLREFVLTDEADVHRYAADAEVVRFTDWGPNTAADTARFIEFASAGSTHDDQFIWAVTLHGDDRAIGSAGLSVESRDHLRADFGYVFAREVWGRGYATEVARLLRTFAFGPLGMHRLTATCHPDNEASIRVLEKAGLAREGRFRDHLRVRGGWRDSLIFAAIDDE